MSGYIQYIFGYIQYIFRYIQYIFWYIKISFNKPKIILWAVNEGHHKRTLGISDFDPMELAEVWIIRHDLAAFILIIKTLNSTTTSPLRIKIIVYDYSAAYLHKFLRLLCILQYNDRCRILQCSYI